MDCHDHVTLFIPDFNIVLRPGCKVKLGRFESTTWQLTHGWYTWGGNRPVCGWYLFDLEDVRNIKPLEQPDLDDIYLVAR